MRCLKVINLSRAISCEHNNSQLHEIHAKRNSCDWHPNWMSKSKNLKNIVTYNTFVGSFFIPNNAGVMQIATPKIKMTLLNAW